MNSAEKNLLVNKARDAARFAYHPVSKTAVGAAVLTTDGVIYQGCNIQSVISGLGCCAESCAIYNAVSHGAYNFVAVAMATVQDAVSKPCGACLQLIHEFSEIRGKNIVILMASGSGSTRQSTIRKMLPGGYGPRTAGKNIESYKKNRHANKKL